MRGSPVYIFPTSLIDKIYAAIHIQAWWKGYYQRKQQKAIFGNNGKLIKVVNWSRVGILTSRYRDYVVCLRAVKVIKNFFFGLKIRRRIEALTNIRDHVAAITSPSLLIEQNFYLNIERLTEHVSRKRNHFFEAQFMRYQIQDSSLALRINLNRYKESVMPSWFNEGCFAD